MVTARKLEGATRSTTILDHLDEHVNSLFCGVYFTMGASSHVPGTAHEITLSAHTICAVPGTLCPELESHPFLSASDKKAGHEEPNRIAILIRSAILIEASDHKAGFGQPTQLRFHRVAEMKHLLPANALFKRL